ncbi:zinc-dependent alcohol dehydrogenase family protein [Paraburkholderia phytofirmans]|uniref:zinc-dependent alcohol dehydrogenase family protein n=1 Tax=Paraburkholderia phytofirmans TaxID=261302 RepID=UPI0038BACC55
MRGIVFLGERELALEDFADPEPAPGEVIIEVKASGMCGTDLHAYRRPKPPVATRVIGGHEPAGIVAALGAGVDPRLVKTGSRVMVHHYAGCTTCEHCRTGWTQLCRSDAMRLFGGNAHGAHAGYLKVPAYTLVPLDDSLSFAAGAAISCGTGTAWGALQRMDLPGRHTIAIFGQGPVGLSATLLAAAQGARVIALDISPARLARAREFGAAETINPADCDAVAAIRQLTAGKGADRALETSGTAQGGSNAMNCLRTWGTACFVGIGADVTLRVRDLLKSQVTVMTSVSMSINAQKECADFIVQRGLEVDRLFTHQWKLDDAVEAYHHFDKQTDGKAVFLM